MLPRLEYLAWAIENYGSVRFDLGQSGMPSLAAKDVAPPEELLAGAADPRAPRRWVEAIAQRFDVDVAAVAPVLGTTHGLWAIYTALLSPGDEVLVEAPAYEPLIRLAEGVGARVVHFRRDLARGAPVEPDEVARALTDRTRLVVISNLHNPSSASVDDATIAEVAKVAARSQAHVLVDEVYRDMIDFRPEKAATAFRVAPNVITTSSLTKVYGLGWARAGWVLAEPKIAKRVFEATLHDAGGISWALSSISEIAMKKIAHLHALSVAARADDDVLGAMADDFVRARPHLSMRRRAGAIFGFVSDSRGVDLRPAIERAVRDEQVIVAPGSFFGAPSGFRLRYGAMPKATLEEGLVRLGRALDRP